MLVWRHLFCLETPLKILFFPIYLPYKLYSIIGQPLINLLFKGPSVPSSPVSPGDWVNKILLVEQGILQCGALSEREAESQILQIQVGLQKEWAIWWVLQNSTYRGILMKNSCNFLLIKSALKRGPIIEKFLEAYPNHKVLHIQIPPQKLQGKSSFEYVKRTVEEQRRGNN